jgi:hypothetical protein
MGKVLINHSSSWENLAWLCYTTVTRLCSQTWSFSLWGCVTKNKSKPHVSSEDFCSWQSSSGGSGGSRASTRKEGGGITERNSPAFFCGKGWDFQGIQMLPLFSFHGFLQLLPWQLSTLKAPGMDHLACRWERDNHPFSRSLVNTQTVSFYSLKMHLHRSFVCLFLRWGFLCCPDWP